MRIRRLTPADLSLARDLFTTIAGVFGEDGDKLGDAYLDRLLGRETFWALAAFDGEQIVGGLTAHTLPLTATEASAVFLYDLAVRRSHQRRGIGRELVRHLRELAAAYHSYYDNERILVDDEKLKAARLALVAACAQVLHNGLAVLGVSAPDKM